MFLEVDHNPNFEGSLFLRFKELGPPRMVSHVKWYERVSLGEWCVVTGWKEDPDDPICPAYAQKVEDSGAGSTFVVYGGNWGLRLKSEGNLAEWDLYDPEQWGEGYLSLADERDLRYIS